MPNKKPLRKVVKKPIKDLSTIKGHEANPRKINATQQRILFKSLEQHGDLSGIVFNRRNQRLIGGHQRFQWFSKSDPVTIIKSFPKPLHDGTTAIGYVEKEGQMFFYREVDLDENLHKAAMLAANKGGGDWDFSLLSQILTDLDDGSMDMELSGFDMTEIENLLSGLDKAPPKKEVSFEAAEPDEVLQRCPNCNTIIEKV
jgi:hypothetical protein